MNPTHNFMDQNDPNKQSFLEAPLQELCRDVNDLTRPPKPIAEMSDEELFEWHGRQRDVTLNHQTFRAHLNENSGGGKGTKATQSMEGYDE